MERNYAQKYSILERTGYLDLMQFQLQSLQKKTTSKTFLQKSERFVQIRLDFWLLHLMQLILQWYIYQRLSLRTFSISQFVCSMLHKWILAFYQRRDTFEKNTGVFQRANWSGQTVVKAKLKRVGWDCNILLFAKLQICTLPYPKRPSIGVADSIFKSKSP